MHRCVRWKRTESKKKKKKKKWRRRDRRITPTRSSSSRRRRKVNWTWSTGRRRSKVWSHSYWLLVKRTVNKTIGQCRSIADKTTKVIEQRDDKNMLWSFFSRVVLCEERRVIVFIGKEENEITENEGTNGFQSLLFDYVVQFNDWSSDVVLPFFFFDPFEIEIKTNWLSYLG